jgi:hypothetical protein
VNCVICVKNKENPEVKCSYMEDNIKTLSQAITIRNSDNHVLVNKHKVILIGDSHLRGYGCNSTSLLSKNNIYVV